MLGGAEIGGLEGLLSEIRRRVVEWERSVWRPYPWRARPSPYGAFVAQFLLRRTTRSAAARKYVEFLARYPDVKSLASASVRELEGLLRDVGMYRVRARQIAAAARYIVSEHGGSIPGDWAELLRVPGLGPYGAGAVLSFGHGVRAPVVDSNSGRVIARLTGASPRKVLPVAWVLVPERNHAEFNYGLVDLGAYVCRKRRPSCAQCPLRDLCLKGGGRALERAYRLLIASTEK